MNITVLFNSMGATLPDLVDDMIWTGKTQLSYYLQGLDWLPKAYMSTAALEPPNISLIS
jgi:hypothetical protein